MPIGYPSFFNALGFSGTSLRRPSSVMVNFDKEPEMEEFGVGSGVHNTYVPSEMQRIAVELLRREIQQAKEERDRVIKLIQPYLGREWSQKDLT